MLVEASGDGVSIVEVASDDRTGGIIFLQTSHTAMNKKYHITREISPKRIFFLENKISGAYAIKTRNS